ncbi:MAG: hypothetical protein R2911_13645 [Caldilineaceae bacterium]
MNAVANVNTLVVKGEFRMRRKGTASDPNKRRFAASARFDLGITKINLAQGYRRSIWAAR